MDLLKEAYKVKGETLKKNLEKRYMESYYCDTKEEAAEKVLSLINQEDTVGWGGSVTIDQLKIKDSLREKGIMVIDRDSAKSPEERTDLMRKALLSDVFLMSANAITMDGELINIDGNGNRVAAICYGPKSVIVVAGMNKVVEDVKSGIKRIKLDACVPNAIRLNTNTPCGITGRCADCTGENSICGHTVITRLSRIKNRIKVILVGESLGL